MIIRNNRPTILGLFRWLDVPFQTGKLRKFSPLNGIQNTIVKNLRINGHFGPIQIKEYELPDKRYKESLYPQDATTWLLIRLFPSSIGLYVNNIKDIINDYLTPQRIAKIFIALHKLQESKTDLESKEFVCKGLHMNAAEKEVFFILINDKSDVLKNIKDKPRETQKKYEKIILGAYQYAKLIVDAYKESTPEQADRFGFPQNVFYRILLKYIWEKNKSDKLNFKPYVDEFLAAGLLDQQQYKRIIWEGFDSIFTDDDFKADDFMPAVTEYEEMIFRDIRAKYFELDLPPVIEFSKSRYTLEKRHKKYPDNDEPETSNYSDCGETLLRNLFNFLLYDKDKDIMDVSRLLKLKELGYHISDKLIHYYTYICTNRETIDSEEARFEWTNVVGYMNTEDDLFKINYMHPLMNDAYVGLREGMDNMMIAIMKLLGLHKHKPKDCRLNINMITKMDCLNNLGIFISLINDTVKNKEVISKVKFLSFAFTESHTIPKYEDLNEPIPVGGWHGFTLVLQFQKTTRHSNRYLLTFDKHHFDFSKDTVYATEIDMMKEKLDINSFIYSQIADSLAGRIAVLASYDGMKSVKKRFNELMYTLDTHAFQHEIDEIAAVGTKAMQYIIDKWVQPDGLYFASWQNEEFNKTIANGLLKVMTIDEILARNIPQLSSPLLLAAMNNAELEWMSKILEYDLAHPADNRNALKDPLNECNNSDLFMLIQLGAQEYAEKMLNLTLLQCLAASTNTKIDDPLPKFGLDVREQAPNGFMPMYYAVNNVSKYMVRYLLREGASAEGLTPDMKTALDVAVEKLILTVKQLKSYRNETSDSTLFVDGFIRPLDQIIKVIEILIIHGCDFSRTPDNIAFLQENLHWIKFSRNEDEYTRHQSVIDMLIQLVSLNGAHQTKQQLRASYDKIYLSNRDQPQAKSKNKRGRIKLFEVIAQGQATLLGQLLNEEANINHKDQRGETPLFVAAQSGRVRFVEQLIARGCELDCANMHGLTPIAIAAKKGHAKSVKSLITAGANMELPDKHGFTPLHHAVMNGKFYTVCALLKNGANINAKTNDGDTVLHLACKSRSIKLVEYFLANGVDTNQCNHAGDLPEDCARRIKDRYIVLLILDHILEKLSTSVTPPPYAPGMFNDDYIKTIRRSTAVSLLRLYILRHYNDCANSTTESRALLTSTRNDLLKYLDCLHESPLKELVKRLTIPGLSLHLAKKTQFKM